MTKQRVCGIDSDFRIEVLSGHLFELWTFRIDERFPFVNRGFVGHEGVQKLEVGHRFFYICCVRRLIVVNIIYELLEVINVIIHGSLVIFLEICDFI